jgi:hypothetical protein
VDKRDRLFHMTWYRHRSCTLLPGTLRGDADMNGVGRDRMTQAKAAGGVLVAYTSDRVAKRQAPHDNSAAAASGAEDARLRTPVRHGIRCGAPDHAGGEGAAQRGNGDWN